MFLGGFITNFLLFILVILVAIRSFRKQKGYDLLIDDSTMEKLISSIKTAITFSRFIAPQESKQWGETKPKKRETTTAPKLRLKVKR